MTGHDATEQLWPTDSLEPPDGPAWDLLVVGGGTAGLVAAQTAAGLGASVLLVEQDRTGGDCLWTGCVPSKALLRIAHAVHDARTLAAFGLDVGRARVDFAAVRREVQAAITTIEPVDSPAALCAAGVHVAHAPAAFVGPQQARVGTTTVDFRQAIVATGSAPALLRIPEPAHAALRTSETIWDLTELPARLLVVGAGSVGCELAQAFARLGSTVTLVEAAGRLLPAEDAAASSVLAGVFAGDGIDVRCGVGVTSVDGGTARLTDRSTIDFDVVLAAVGRIPRTADLGLAAAGVRTDARGYVRVDAALRTSNPRIWAAGDVTGQPQFTHVAGVHASLAASNAVLGLRRHVDAVVPRVTFTQPEVAAVGEQIEPRGGRSRTIEHTEVDRAITDGDPAGFTRLVADRRGRVRGGLVVGPRAGESLAEIALAVRQGARLRDLAGLTHAYPTYSDGVWKAGIADVRASLAGGAGRRVSGLLARLRRSRLDRR